MTREILEGDVEIAAPAETGFLGEDAVFMLSISRENRPAESEALNVAK
ncbi:MAG TPA: hypothetical protein VM492_05015 [Sumerlaeia bacterium]|nr:hypothetical protein [Sumerlaeia bacterium]